MFRPGPGRSSGSCNGSDAGRRECRQGKLEYVPVTVDLSMRRGADRIAPDLARFVATPNSPTIRFQPEPNLPLSHLPHAIFVSTSIAKWISTSNSSERSTSGRIRLEPDLPFKPSLYLQLGPEHEPERNYLFSGLLFPTPSSAARPVSSSSYQPHPGPHSQ